MAKKTVGASAPAALSTDNKLSNAQNAICEASFVAHFLRGVFSKAIDGGEGIELSAAESCGLINVVDDLITRIEGVISLVDECRTGAHHD